MVKLASVTSGSVAPGSWVTLAWGPRLTLGSGDKLVILSRSPHHLKKCYPLLDRDGEAGWTRVCVTHQTSTASYEGLFK